MSDTTTAPAADTAAAASPASPLGGAGLYGVAPFFGPWKTNHAWAQSAQKKPLVIGLTMDASAASTRASGGEERLGAMMAIKEFNAKGGVLGRHDRGDPHGHRDDAGHRLARRRADDHAQRSGVPDRRAALGRRQRDLAGRAEVRLRLPQHQLELADRGRARTATASSSSGTATAPTSRTAIVKNAMKVNGKNWVLLTNDYVWGHNTSKATRAIVEANGGKIVDELLVPQNTRDFSSYLLKLQQIKPDVVAAAVGGDDIKALRQQVVQLEDATRARRGSTTSRTGPTSTASGPEQIFGVFGTNWYWRLDLPGVKEFVASYQKAYPGHGDPGAGQRLLQRLHGDARAAARGRAKPARPTTSRSSRSSKACKMTARDRMQHYDA